MVAVGKRFQLNYCNALLKLDFEKMLYQNLTFLITFIITAGIAIIGFLGTYNLFQQSKKPVLQILLYQQIFLFSFFMYGIWGNIAIREVISDLNLDAETNHKLALFIPVLGMPFLIVSWFMLLKFAFNINGYKLSKNVVLAYFVSFIAALIIFSFLVQNGTIHVPAETDLFIVRILAAINLAIHLVLIFPYLKPHKSASELEKRSNFRAIFFIYLSGVMFYSVFLYFFNFYGFVSICFSILLLFGVSIIIPAGLKLKPIEKADESTARNINFEKFCETYEISKREAEIILEICSGKTNKSISDKLFITLQTVKDHNHRIFTKTQVKSRVQLTNLVREKTGMTSFPGQNKKE